MFNIYYQYYTIYNVIHRIPTTQNIMVFTLLLQYRSHYSLYTNPEYTWYNCYFRVSFTCIHVNYLKFISNWYMIFSFNIRSWIKLHLSIKKVWPADQYGIELTATDILALCHLTIVSLLFDDLRHLRTLNSWKPDI